MRPLTLPLLGLFLLLAGCASQPEIDPSAPGFWMGLIQGAIAPITFVISLFNPEVAMYQYPNNGAWYNLGFLLGLGLVWGGGGAAANRS